MKAEYQTCIGKIRHENDSAFTFLIIVLGFEESDMRIQCQAVYILGTNGIRANSSYLSI